MPGNDWILDYVILIFLSEAVWHKDHGNGCPVIIYDYIVSEIVSLHGPSIHDLMLAFVFPGKQSGAYRRCLDYQHRVQFFALTLQHCTVVSL